MLGKRKVFILILFILFFSPVGGDTDNVLLNGTSIYLTTGDTFGLFQGYFLNVKSVSPDGSVWLQLTLNDKMVESDIVGINEYFYYNKTDLTILSIRVENVYSGSTEQNLVSMFPVYQYVDPDLPEPVLTGIAHDDNQSQENEKPPVRIHTPLEPLIWTTGILLVLILYYFIRKFW